LHQKHFLWRELRIMNKSPSFRKFVLKKVKGCIVTDVAMCEEVFRQNLNHVLLKGTWIILNPNLYKKWLSLSRKYLKCHLQGLSKKLKNSNSSDMQFEV
jgi:hypothetical protein